MTDNNDALFREVDEELRREQWERLWKSYGSYVIAGAALIVLLVGGKQFYDARQRALSEAAGAQYTEALALSEDGKTEEAQKALAALSASGTAGYATLAELKLAGSYVKSGKTAEALAIFENLSTNAADPLLADYATLQAAALKLGDGDYTEMQNRLNRLTSDTNPWRVRARELLGTAAMKAGKLEVAKEHFTSILGDAATSREAAGRVNMMLASITAAELAAKAAAGAGAQEEPAPPASPPSAVGAAGK